MDFQRTDGRRNSITGYEFGKQKKRLIQTKKGRKNKMMAEGCLINIQQSTKTKQNNSQSGMCRKHKNNEYTKLEGISEGILIVPLKEVMGVNYNSNSVLIKLEKQNRK